MNAERPWRPAAVAAPGPTMQAPESADAGGTPGALTVVPFVAALSRNGRDVVAFVVATPAISLLAVGLLLIGGAGPVAATGVAVAAAVSFVLVIFWRRARIERVARQLGAAVSPTNPAETVSRALHACRGSFVAFGLRGMTEAMGRRGVVDRTFLVAAPGGEPALEPLAMPFEPQPLNELESTLLREGGVQKARGEAQPSFIRRNMILKGGWAIALVFGFNWFIALVDTLREGRLDGKSGWRLLWWSVFLAALLLIPVHAGRWNEQWLLVPGGVVLRRSGWFRGGWDLYVFDRRRSVLLAGCLNGGRWGAFLADAEQNSMIIGTKREIELLLRGWLSPLAPPPLERLADLR